MKPLGFGKASSPKKSLQQEVRQFRRKITGEPCHGSKVLPEVATIEAKQLNRKSDLDANVATDECIKEAGNSDDRFNAPLLDSSGQDGTRACIVASNSGSFEASHEREWLHSCIDREIVELNFKSLSGKIVYDYLLYSPDLPRRNDGRLSESILKKYRFIEIGGWWCDGINLLTFEDSLWGCFKPNEPRDDTKKPGKKIKYEHPPKVDTEIFALRIPGRIWELISRRYDVALPENYQDLPYGDFWRWVIQHPQIPVIVGEGAKKAAAILSCGYVAISLAGVFNGCRQLKDEFGEVIGMPSLIPQLKVFAQPGRRIYFCFDQDSKRQTVSDVNKALSKTAKLFIKHGCEVKCITWHPVLGKGVDDIVSAYGHEKLDKLYRDALDFEKWQSLQLKRLTYKPDLVLNQRYLGEFTPPQNAQLIGLKAPKNNGKTQWLSWITDPVIRSGEKKVLVITHRLQLGTQIAERLGLPFITEVKESGQGSHFGMGLCVDSLHPKSQARFNPDEWKGCWVIFDEIQQLIWHLLNSKTCQNERVSIIKSLKQLLLNVVNYGGKIFIADADLNDISIEFIKGLIGLDIETWIVQNDYKFEQGWKVNIFKGNNPAQLVKHLENKLKLGEKHFVCLSGQKAKSKWGSRNLEAHFKKVLPDLKILRIDSQTVEDKQHPAFGCIGNINEVVVGYDLVLSTPTIETGVSIEREYFDGVWGIFQGVQTTDSVRQHLSRYRPAVPRYIWVKEIGINKIGNGATTVKGLLAGEYKKDKANIRRLIDAGFEEIIDDNFEPICLRTWAKMACIINMGMHSYAKQIISDLEEEGHTIFNADDLIQIPSDEESESLKEEIFVTCEEEYLKHTEAVAETQSISDEKFEKLSRQRSKTQQEQLEYRKGELERRYQIPVTADLVKKDDNNWYSQIRLHYYLSVGREYLLFRDQNVMAGALKNGDGDYFKPDMNSKLLANKVAALNFLGIFGLLEETDYSENHSLIQEIFSKCQKHLHDLKLILGIDFSKEDKAIRCVQRLLSLIGYKLPYLRREGTKQNRTRIYGRPAADFQKDSQTNKLILDTSDQAIPISDGREEVFRAWLERDAESMQKAEQHRAVSKMEPDLQQRENLPIKQQEMQLVTETEKQEWLTDENLQVIANDLAKCEDSEALTYLRQCYPDFAMKAAARLLPLPTQKQIKQWVIEQNQQQSAYSKQLYRAIC